MGQQNPGSHPQTINFNPISMTPFTGQPLTYNPITGSASPEYQNLTAQTLSNPSQYNPTLMSEYTPVEAQSLQYQQLAPYAQALQNIGNMVNQTPAENQYLNAGGDYINRVMANGYSAYSPEDMQQMYQNQADKITENIIKPQEAQLSARLANQGLAGSGITGQSYTNQAAENERLLADVYSNIQQENRNATRQERSQALGMIPQMAQMQMEAQQQPLQNQMAWANLLAGENQNYNQFAQWNAEQQNSMNQFNTQNQLNVNQWNAAQQNEAGMWNAGQQNQFNMWNAEQQNAMNQFNAQNQLQNAQWSAGQQNSMNQFNAQNMMNANQFNAEHAYNQWAAQNQLNQWNAQMGMQSQQYNNQNLLNWMQMMFNHQSQQGQNAQNWMSTIF